MSNMNMDGNGGKIAFRKTLICEIIMGKKPILYLLVVILGRRKSTCMVTIYLGKIHSKNSRVEMNKWFHQLKYTTVANGISR